MDRPSPCTNAVGRFDFVDTLIFSLIFSGWASPSTGATSSDTALEARIFFLVARSFSLLAAILQNGTIKG